MYHVSCNSWSHFKCFQQQQRTCGSRKSCVDAACAGRQEGSRWARSSGGWGAEPSSGSLLPCPHRLVPLQSPAFPALRPIPSLCLGEGSADRCSHPRVIDPGFSCYSHSRVSLSSDHQLSVAKQCGVVLSELDGMESCCCCAVGATATGPLSLLRERHCVTPL